MLENQMGVLSKDNIMWLPHLLTFLPGHTGQHPSELTGLFD